MIQENVPALTNKRMICVLNDTPRKLKKKYIVMEWIEGEVLTKLKEKIFHKESDFLRMCLILFHQLSLLHEKGIIHRDIKTENVMFFKDPFDKDNNEFYFGFIDFGCSFMFSSNELKVHNVSPPFSPPEQNSDLESYRTDIYSLGVTLNDVIQITKIKVK